MEAIEGGQEGLRETLPPISPMDKIIVAFAGPLFSFLLAAFFAVVVWQVGYPDRRVHTTQIGWIKPDSPAELAGLKAGDTIKAIDGVAVTSWDEPINSVIERIAFGNNEKLAFTVERPGEAKLLTIPTGFTIEKGGFIQRTGMRKVGIASALPAKVEMVIPDSPADRAGLKAGDIIVKADGQDVFSPFAIDMMFDENAGRQVNINVKRSTETPSMVLAVEKPSAPDGLEPMTGIIWDNAKNAASVTLAHPTPGKQLATATTMMVRTIGGLVTPGSDISFQHLSGPVKIFNLYYRLFEQPDGWRLVLWFSVILNVNLALLNLLPFPVLDGGHITMALIEIIRRRPVLNLKALEIFQTACALTLFGFMIYVTWFDSWDLVGGKKDVSEEVKIEDIKFAPKPVVTQ
jgi:regulator of sigma E protease